MPGAPGAPGRPMFSSGSLPSCQDDTSGARSWLGSYKPAPSRQGPMVRIHLPPAESPMRTSLASSSVSPSSTTTLSTSRSSTERAQISQMIERHGVPTPLFGCRGRVQNSLPPCRPAIALGTIAERAAIVREGLDDLLLKRARLPPGSVRQLAEKQDHVIVRAGRTASARPARALPYQDDTALQNRRTKASASASARCSTG
jgi:hypothetical protein